METLRLVNSYGDAYGVASKQPMQKKNVAAEQKRSTGGGSGGSGRAQESQKSTSSGGFSLPKVGGGVAPKSAPKAAPLTPAEAARIARARAQLAKMVGWMGVASDSTTFRVSKGLGGKAILSVKTKGDKRFRDVVDASTRAWLGVAEAAIAAYKSKAPKFQSSGRAAPATSSDGTTTTTTDTSAGTSETPTDTSGSSGGASAPAWASQPYLTEMSAVVG